jgi:hypothetical protein
MSQGLTDTVVWLEEYSIDLSYSVHQLPGLWPDKECVKLLSVQVRLND